MHITVRFDKTKNKVNYSFLTIKMVAALDTTTKIYVILTLYKPYVSKQNYFNARNIMKIDSL